MGSIRMSGTGRTASRPDVATIGVVIETQKQTSADARRLNSNAVKGLIAAVRLCGVDGKDIQTSAYRLSARPRLIKQGKRRGDVSIAGFTVENVVRIKLRNISLVDQVMDRLGDAGATSISGPHFAIDNVAALRDEARKAAFERARSKAQLYCRLAGMKIVGLKELKEVVHPDWQPSGRSHIRAGGDLGLTCAADDDNDARIVAGQSEVSVSVECEFEIAAARRARQGSKSRLQARVETSG